jgi:hypothetical protein
MQHRDKTFHSFSFSEKYRNKLSGKSKGGKFGYDTCGTVGNSVACQKQRKKGISYQKGYQIFNTRFRYVEQSVFRKLLFR